MLPITLNWFDAFASSPPGGTSCRIERESGLRLEHFLYKVHLCGPLCSQNAVGVGRNVSTLENSCVTYKLDHHTVVYKCHISRNTAITQALQMRLFDVHSTCSKNRKMICPPTLTTVYISSWWLCCHVDHFLHCLGHKHQFNLSVSSSRHLRGKQELFCRAQAKPNCTLAKCGCTGRLRSTDSTEQAA